MKKKFLTVILALPILMLVACNNQTGVGSSSLTTGRIAKPAIPAMLASDVVS